MRRTGRISLSKPICDSRRRNAQTHAQQDRLPTSLGLISRMEIDHRWLRRWHPALRAERPSIDLQLARRRVC